MPFHPLYNLVIAAFSALTKRLLGKTLLLEFYVELIVYALCCMVPYKINNGSNAGRVVFLILFLLSIFFMLGGGYRVMSNVDLLYGTISLPIEIYIVYKLFFTEAAGWFKNKASLGSVSQ